MLQVWNVYLLLLWMPNLHRSIYYVYAWSMRKLFHLITQHANTIFTRFHNAPDLSVSTIAFISSLWRSFPCILIFFICSKLLFLGFKCSSDGENGKVTNNSSTAGSYVFK